MQSRGVSELGPGGGSYEGCEGGRPLLGRPCCRGRRCAELYSLRRSGLQAQPRRRADAPGAESDPAGRPGQDRERGAWIRPRLFSLWAKSLYTTCALAFSSYRSPHPPPFFAPPFLLWYPGCQPHNPNVQSFQGPGIWSASLRGPRGQPIPLRDQGVWFPCLCPLRVFVSSPPSFPLWGPCYSYPHAL